MASLKSVSRTRTDCASSSVVAQCWTPLFSQSLCHGAKNGVGVEVGVGVVVEVEVGVEVVVEVEVGVEVVVEVGVTQILIEAVRDEARKVEGSIL